jgi:hypothetical protein
MDWVRIVATITKPFNYFTYILIFALIECVSYKILTKVGIEEYWIAISVVLYLVSSVIHNFSRKLVFTSQFLGAISIGALILMFFYVNIESINVWVNSNAQLLSFLILLIYFVNMLILTKNIKKGHEDYNADKDNSNLFNLFYINTSKAHEIAMLIDNKIMKTVEKEQISEELLKYTSFLSLNAPNKLTTEMGYVKEDNSKKKVYESFDVKTTKSIMLKKIYETIRFSNQQRKSELNAGDLVVFKNVELRQRNVDDTVFVLNILRDTNVKNASNDSVEINLNKMMDKMLDDFTIDYVFKYKVESEEKDYIIQLPFKNNDNFENGYHHNDLQLGKLSLIGIYRGEIDFSQRESTSSKFLELMSDSYKNELGKVSEGIMKTSNHTNNALDIQFEFSHSKLNEVLNLIDVIAIIQELNIDRTK